MRNDRSKAEKLRKSGKSYKDIGRSLGIPLGTISSWFKDLPWSREIRDRLARESSFSSPEKLEALRKFNIIRWRNLHESYREEAIREYPRFQNDPIFIAGLMLYWGEGDKSPKNSQVRISNTTPGIIKIFYHFLRLVGAPQDKIAIQLLLYPDFVDSVYKDLWSKALGQPISKFRKSTYIMGRHKTKKNSFGICIVCIGSRRLKEKILKWIELSELFLHGQALTRFS